MVLMHQKVGCESIEKERKTSRARCQEVDPLIIVSRIVLSTK